MSDETSTAEDHDAETVVTEPVSADGSNIDAKAAEDQDLEGRLTLDGTGRWFNRACIVVAVLALVGAGIMFQLGSKERSADDDDAEAVRVATASIQTLLSYTAATVDQELLDEKGLLTGKFADGYEKLVTEALAPAAKKGNMTTSAVVKGAAPVEGSKAGIVSVLMFLDVTTTATGQTQPGLTASRLIVSMKQVDGKWRVSEITPI